MENKRPIKRVLTSSILILALFFQVHSSLIGQIDSLTQLLKTDIADTTRIDALDNLSRSFFGINVDSAIYFAQQAVAIGDRINDLERKGYSLKNIGIGYYYKGEFVETLNYWEQSLAVFEKINHLPGISNLLSNIGSVYNSTGDYSSAVDHHLRALRIAEESNDQFRKATVLQNIGAVYSNMEEYLKSKDYYEQALELCHELEYEKGIGIIVMNLSEVYRNTGDLDKAAALSDEAKELFKKLNDPSLVEAMIAKSDINIRRGLYRKAIEEAKEAISIATSNQSKSFMQRGLVTLGRAYNKTNRLREARKSFEDAIDLSDEGVISFDLQQAYIGLVESNRLLRDYKNLSIAQDSLLSINKQVYDIEKDDNISNLQLEFDLEKRDSELALLNADNEIKSQEIARATLRSRLLMAVAGFLVLLIGGLVYLYKYSQNKNKIILEERNRSDQLLMNILPPETAEELKKNGIVVPKRYDYTTVLFTDFVEFTSKSEAYSPEILVSSIDYYFKRFDEIVLNNHLEKIKTIGDAYMCAGGLHTEDLDSITITKNTINAAAEILQFMETTLKNPPQNIVPFQIRIGIASGPVVAGVVGQSKFQYDIWGDTVNVAFRMEANSEPNKINVSENIIKNVNGTRGFVHRGAIEVKNKGMMDMYFYSES